MSEVKTQADYQPGRRRGGIAGALILIVLGVAFLLDNLGIVDVNWSSLWRYWPALLILIGLDLLLGHRSALGSVLVVLLSILVVGAIILAASAGTFNIWLSSPVVRDIAQEFDPDLASLDVELFLGGVDARVHALPSSESDQYAARGTLETNRDLPLDIRYDAAAGHGQLYINQKLSDENPEFAPGVFGELDLGLTPDIPLHLKVVTGAGATVLDLSGLQIGSLEVTSGAGALTVILPEAGDIDVVLNSGVGAVMIRLPSTMGARVDYAGASLIEGGARLERREPGYWETSGYATSDNQVDFVIRSGLGIITFEDR